MWKIRSFICKFLSEFSKLTLSLEPMVWLILRLPSRASLWWTAPKEWSSSIWWVGVSIIPNHRRILIFSALPFLNPLNDSVRFLSILPSILLLLEAHRNVIIWDLNIGGVSSPVSQPLSILVQYHRGSLAFLLKTDHLGLCHPGSCRRNHGRCWQSAQILSISRIIKDLRRFRCQIL